MGGAGEEGERRAWGYVMKLAQCMCLCLHGTLLYSLNSIPFSFFFYDHYVCGCIWDSCIGHVPNGVVVHPDGEHILYPLGKHADTIASTH